MKDLRFCEICGHELAENESRFHDECLIKQLRNNFPEDTCTCQCVEPITSWFDMCSKCRREYDNYLDWVSDHEDNREDYEREVA